MTIAALTLQLRFAEKEAPLNAASPCAHRAAPHHISPPYDMPCPPHAPQGCCPAVPNVEECEEQCGAAPGSVVLGIGGCPLCICNQPSQLMQAPLPKRR